MQQVAEVLVAGTAAVVLLAPSELAGDRAA
jgi:hypothetical protein